MTKIGPMTGTEPSWAILRAMTDIRWSHVTLAVGLLLTVGGCSQEKPTAETATAELAGASVDEPGSAAPPWPRLDPPADLPQDRALQVGFLIIDGVYNTELTAPYDIFQHTIFHAPPGMEVFTVSPDGAAVTSFEGLEIGAHHSFESAPPVDVLVVPSAEHNMDSDLENEELIAWVRATGERAAYVMSLCDGAFVLAKAGLLEGLAVTTFPSDQDRFAEMFPDLDLRRGVSFVHDGRALTSEGGARSFDIAMYLADLLYGEKAAQGIGRGLIIPWPPVPGTMPALVVGPSAEDAS